MKIKELRKEKELKQSEIAEILNCSQTTFSDWERERSEPPINMLIKLADFFDVSVDYLIGRADELERVTIKNDLTQDETEMLKAYRKLQTELKFQLLGYALGLLRQHSL